MPDRIVLRNDKTLSQSKGNVYETVSHLTDLHSMCKNILKVKLFE